VLVQAGQLDEAISILTDVHRRLLVIAGTETEISARAINQLGMAYYFANRYADALPAFQAALDYSVRARGETSDLSLGAANSIANTLAHMGRTKDAIVMAQKLFETKSRVEGPTQADTIWFERDLATDYRLDGNLPRAEQIYRDVVVRARAIFMHGEYSLGQYESELGEVLALEHKSDEARALLTESLVTLTKSLGPADRHTLHAQALLASLPTSH
jgi:tetratricopeptide (TPR) repeat protein